MRTLYLRDTRYKVPSI